MTLREIVQALRETYCGTIGAEYMHITEPTEKRWWQQRLESIRSQAELQRRGEDPHPRPPDRRRRPRALPAHQVRRPEALLARRRRELHRLDGRVRPARRRQGRAGDRDRHGAPRPPQRARQHARQDAEGPVRRVRPHRAGEPALGRRQVPPGLLERHHDAGRPGPPEPGVQPVAPRDRQPGRRRLGQGAPGPPRRRRGRHGAAGDRPRRRGVRRAGRRDGDAGARADARLLHRRHGPHRHQQPDRLHDLATRATRARRCTAPTSSR